MSDGIGDGLLLTKSTPARARHHPSPGISHVETISRQSQGGGIVQEALIAPGPVWFATNDKML